MQRSYIYFPTFAMVNKRDKARKAVKKKVTAAAQKSDSIKIRLPAAVRRKPSPRHEQDTPSRTNSEAPNERDSITPPPRLHVDPGKVRDAVDALLGMGHPLVEGLDAMARGVSIGQDRHEDVELEDKEMAEGDDDVGTEGGDARDPMDEVDELDNDESSSESGKLSQVHQEL